MKYRRRKPKTLTTNNYSSPSPQPRSGVQYGNPTNTRITSSYERRVQGTSSQGRGKLPLPPTTIVLMYPEYFAKKVTLGGYKSSFSNVKVSHHKLSMALVQSGIWYMYYNGVIGLNLARVDKHYEVVVVKKGDVSLREYGLTSRIVEDIDLGRKTWLRIGITKIYNERTNIPFHGFVNKFHEELRMFNLTPQHKPLYQKHALWLNQLLHYYSINYAQIYKTVSNDTVKALSSLVPPSDDTDFY